MKLTTEVECPALPVQLSLNDRIMVLGSCFSDSIGMKLRQAGYNLCVNPFGTVYNPLSVLQALRRLDEGNPFGLEDCVPMGAGVGKICSFSHHTSFARATDGDFLHDANSSLERDSAFWLGCNKLLVTFGTAYVWRHLPDGQVVANCLKRPSTEFERVLLDVGEVRAAVRDIISLAGERKIIFTVSPIRHLGSGAHLNTLGKAALHLGLDPESCYFPSYEILTDELRDYRYYADNDLCHPSSLAVDIIWEKFKKAALCPQELARVAENERAARRTAHRTNLSFMNSFEQSVQVENE